MARKRTRNTRGRIIAAAWKLFYEQGYENTTVEEIIEASSTSKGSFYHYFEGKDTLLSSLSYLFDEKYQELEAQLDPEGNRFESLLFLNRQLFGYIENSVSLELLGRLLSSQLITRGDKHLLDHNRVYYRLLRRLCLEGQQRGGDPGGYHRQRVCEGLCPGRAGPDVRLVPVQRRIFPGRLRLGDDAPFPQRLPAGAQAAGAPGGKYFVPVIFSIKYSFCPYKKHRFNV